jgi:hypothetical protein
MSEERQKAVWPWIAIAVLLAVLYVASFGPACWIDERMEIGTGWVSMTYRPIIRRASRSPFMGGMMVRVALQGEFGVPGTEYGSTEYPVGRRRGRNCNGGETSRLENLLHDRARETVRRLDGRLARATSRDHLGDRDDYTG